MISRAGYLWQDDFLWLTIYNKMMLCNHRNWGLSTNVTIISLYLAMLNSWVLENTCKMGKRCPMCSIWKIQKLVCEIQCVVDIKEERPLLLWADSLQGFRNVQKGFSDLAHLGGESKLGTQSWLVLLSPLDSLKPYLSMGHFTILLHTGFASCSSYLLPFLCLVDIIFMWLISIIRFLLILLI